MGGSIFKRWKGVSFRASLTGRVFDASREGGRGVYPGLYITDAAAVPTALGVNPSLTISALALRAADTIIEEMS